jgi:hypothetical protein
VNPSQLSPYPCTTLDLCQRLGTPVARRAILGKFLDFCERLRGEGLTNRFRWLDGNFLEVVEARQNRPPKDLDVVTVYWGYDRAFQTNLVARFREFASPRLSKAAYGLNHSNFDASQNPPVTLEQTRYWILLFSHNRQGVWKGMLRIELNMPAEDASARLELERHTP